MAVTKIEWHWFHGCGNGYTTIDVNIPPAWVGAQIALHGKSGGGTNFAGIKHYRKRLDSGADEDHDFGDWPSWPPFVGDVMSSVTFAIATGSDQDAWALARMDYWA